MKLLRILSALLLLSLAGCTVTPLVNKEDKRTPREPESGLMLGATPRLFGPKDAPRAALFVHGFLGAGSNFDDLPARLAAEGWRVRVMLLPGHGTSPSDLELTKSEEVLQAVREEIAGLRVDYDEIAVIGHSLGGTLATIAAADGTVDLLVLAGPFYDTPRPWYSPMSVDTATGFADGYWRWLYKGDLFKQIFRAEAKPDVHSYVWVPVQAIIEAQRLTTWALDPEIAAKIACPILWLHSEADKAASFEAAKEMVERMPGPSTFVNLPNTNHIVFFDWDRELAKEAVLQFLDENSRIQTDG